ncbi:MAG: hypothetical protein KDK66_00575 [Deltaproteobacteria bacterium]|nr:hypothetical protein [Deltaproteobacteria bacterium]
MKAKYITHYVTIIAILFFSSACGLKKTATKITTQVFYDATPSMDEESDVDLASHASLAFLKMLDSFYLQNPKDKTTLLLLTRAYSSYAYGFTENAILEAQDLTQQKKSKTRAKEFYRRAKKAAMELLDQKGLSKARQSSLEAWKKALKGKGKKDLEDLFWIAFAWGNYLNWHKDDIAAIGEIPKVQSLMERVYELDPNYYHGGPSLLLGGFYASRPPMLGGQPKLAKEFFEQALEANQGQHLMAKVAYAQFYAVQTQKRELFNRLLNEVIQGDAEAKKELILSNKLAKIRAKLLLKKADNFFATN